MNHERYLTRVAIVGAGGNVGSYMTEALLASGKHTITAVSRPDSESKLPQGVEVRSVNYNDHGSIVSALRNQDAFIITLTIKAGIKWVFPNEWGFNTTNEALCKDITVSQIMINIRDYLKQSGLSYTSVVTGFWYEWSLAIRPAYGIDINNRKATLFDDGRTRISTWTWPKVGRAVTSLLSLPINSKDRLCLTNYQNQVVHISSFTLSQRDMLNSLCRVTDTTESDWNINFEPTQQRYKNGLEGMKQGSRVDFAKAMYTPVESAISSTRRPMTDWV